jgi:hypothetical protein
VKYRDEISFEIRKEIETLAFEFREAYFSIDPPNDVYKQSKRIVKSISAINDYKMFDSHDEYPKYMDLAAFYNENYRLFTNIKTAVHNIY